MVLHWHRVSPVETIKGLHRELHLKLERFPPAARIIQLSHARQNPCPGNHTLGKGLSQGARVVEILRIADFLTLCSLQKEILIKRRAESVLFSVPHYSQTRDCFSVGGRLGGRRLTVSGDVFQGEPSCLQALLRMFDLQLHHLLTSSR